MKPLSVSVVIPTYNRAALVTRAVKSALAAIRTGDEIIVVDDGSTDSTRSMLAQFGDRIRYIPLTNGGAGIARNRGIAEATKDLVAFLDSDDEWMPDKLRIQVPLMEARPEVLFCFSNFSHRAKDGKETSNFITKWHNDSRSWNDILGPSVQYSILAKLTEERKDFAVHFGDLYLPAMERFYIFTTTLVVRREKAGEALRFAEDLKTYEDWYCYGRLAHSGQAAYLDVDTCFNCSHGGSRLTDANKFIGSQTALKVLDRVWGSDPHFLSKHRAQYEAVCAKHHLACATWLLRQGRVEEARSAIRQSGGAPLMYRALAALPRSVLVGIFGLRAMLKGHGHQAR